MLGKIRPWQKKTIRVKGRLSMTVRCFFILYLTVYMDIHKIINCDDF